jgi:hypothetical protein
VPIFAAFLAISSAAAPGCALDPVGLAHEATKDPRAVVSRLWSRACEEQALTGFSSGKSEWVALAVILRPHTDAWSGESLMLSMGEAKRRAPSRVLPLVDNPNFGTAVCFPDSFDDSAEGIRATDRKFAQAVPAFKKFLGTRLAPQARKCLEAFAEWKTRQAAR